jgi:hypothetical protein
MAKRDNPVDHEQGCQAVALRAGGLTPREVAARVGVSQACVCRLLRAAGVPARPAARRFTPEEARAAGRKGARARWGKRQAPPKAGATG